MKKVVLRISLISTISILYACSHSTGKSASESFLSSEELDSKFQVILKEHRLATVGAAKIQEGELIWTGYYGKQSKGVSASARTMFNVASVAKTITSELIIKLASEGVISLDEEMHSYWVDPDLAQDPRHRELTPRLALNHRTGLPNWRYLDSEFQLRFTSDPGTKFGYSGEGMDYVARFVEEKTGKTFDTLVKEYLFKPIGLSGISVKPEPWVIERLALPVDEDGVEKKPFCSSALAHYCTEEGQWSAADELATTVEDYAKFMLYVMKGTGVNSNLEHDRTRIQSSTMDHPVLSCKLDDKDDCPSAQGYALGWEVFEFTDAKIVSHGGSDWSERAMVYFDPQTLNGVIVFINGPASTNAEALIDVLNALDPGSKLARLYRGWIDAYKSNN